MQTQFIALFFCSSFCYNKTRVFPTKGGAFHGTVHCTADPEPERAAELPVAGGHAGVRRRAGRSRRAHRPGRAGVSGGHRQLRQHGGVWRTVSVQSGQVCPQRHRPLLPGDGHAQCDHDRRAAVRLRRDGADFASGPAVQGPGLQPDRHHQLAPEHAGQNGRHDPAVLHHCPAC